MGNFTVLRSSQPLCFLFAFKVYNIRNAMQNYTSANINAKKWEEMQHFDKNNISHQQALRRFCPP